MCFGIACVDSPLMVEDCEVKTQLDGNGDCYHNPVQFFMCSLVFSAWIGCVEFGHCHEVIGWTD